MSHKSLKTCLKCSLPVLFMLFLQAVHAQPDWAELDAEILSKQKALGNDAVVMVWATDTLVYRKEMGEFNSKTQAPLASASKWLTAALVMQFVDEGKISLDDPVVKYIPIFEKYSKSYITIRHCLSHMTGITDDANFLKKILQKKKFSSLEEEVNGFAAREIRDNPGKDFWYGNVGLNIAGRVLEVVSKKKFDLLIKQKLFNPLGMRKTSFSNLDASAVNPSGGAQSTAEDYMKFLVMLLNKGTYQGKVILSESSVEQLLQTQTNSEQIKYTPKPGEGYGYALGSWVIEKDADNQAKVLASPGLLGTWPMIDFCRGYAYLVLVKKLLTEERATIHEGARSMINKQLKDGCN